MNNPVMVVEVNRLMAGLLLSEGAVFLPSVGTLRVVRYPAKRLTKRSVRPPYRAVEFASSQAGVSLIEGIARAIRIAGGDPEQAEAIYNRWFTYVQKEGVLTIEGVGVLTEKHLALDPDFDKRLNPQGREPVRLKPIRRSDWAVWIGSAAILFAAAAGGYEYLMTIPDPAEELARAEVRTEIQIPDPVMPVEPADSILAVAEVVDTTAKRADLETTAVPSHPSVSSQAVPQSLPSETLTPGRRYVVVGVFSTAANAERAARAAMSQDPAMQCRVYPFGAKWMVSGFESGDVEACTKFIREKADKMPDLWTYTAK